MRRLAGFSLEATHTDRPRAETVNEVVQRWLSGKGTPQGADPASFTLTDGRQARCERSETLSDDGLVYRTVLREPMHNGKGTFVTEIEVIEWHDGVAVSSILSSASEGFVPQWIDVRRPRFIDELLRLPSTWTYRGTTLSARPLRLDGDGAIDLIWNDSRSVPVVVISNEWGADLHPSLAGDLASDLAGVALVASIDQAASWRITAVKGREWSCYGGAIRIYWPGIGPSSSPFVNHKLWTAHSLMDGVSDTAEAASRIRDQLRRMVLSQSAFTIDRHPRASAVIRASRRAELERFKSQAQDGTKVVERLEFRILELEDDLDAAEKDNADLRAQVSSYIEALAYAPGAGAPATLVAAEDEAPPETVEEAVAIARSRFQDTLAFGLDVNRGVQTLTADAGPPVKILKYLEALDAVTRKRRTGSLGKDLLRWLEQEMGVKCSAESASVTQSPTERQMRTWATDTGNKMFFEKHMKPKDGTSPDQCARIYFEYDDERNVMVVGWVGRHPGT